MKLSARLDEADLIQAVRHYVAKELGGTVSESGVQIHMVKAMGDDPRERDYVYATVEYQA